MATSESATDDSKQGQGQMSHHQHPVERFKYSNRAVLRSVVGRDDGGIGLVGERVVVGGWVKSCKEKPKTGVAVADVACPEVVVSLIPILRHIARLLAKGGPPPVGKVEAAAQPRTLPFVAYLRINDGSCVPNLQVVVDSSLYPLGQITHVGTSILLEGVIQKPTSPTKRPIELRAERILHAGSVDLDRYPLGKSRLSLDFMRPYPHLRPRSSTVASVTRIRNSLSLATHLFFQSNGFIHVHMPVITADSSTTTDRNIFQVTTLLSGEDAGEMNDGEDASLRVVRAAIEEKSARIEELKRSDSNREVLIGALRDLQKANELAQQLEKQHSKALVSVKARKLDFSMDFFARRAYLSASSQLHLESYACALSSVYTFGPAFHAHENADHKKKLAETWQIEAALAFTKLEDAMNCAEDCLKFLCHTILENCPHDLKLMSKSVDHECIGRIQAMSSSPFARITYTEVLEILKKAENKKFGEQAGWGISLSREHERYLADEVFKQPIIIYEYPKEVKPFYVRARDDGRTVSAFDIIAPKVGVLVQGSQKEERINKIRTRIQEVGLPREQYEWYLDLRRHGTVKNAGFSIGFEGLVMFATGIEDVRDVIPFPRAKHYANV